MTFSRSSTLMMCLNKTSLSAAASWYAVIHMGAVTELTHIGPALPPGIAQRLG